MRFLLDTNILVAGLNGEQLIRRRLADLKPTQILLCTLVLAELRFGAELSQRREENLHRLEDLARRLPVAEFDARAAEYFGALKARLRRQGIAKSDFDLAIAAVSLSRGATLVSNDQAFHKTAIPDLEVEDWLTSPA